MDKIDTINIEKMYKYLMIKGLINNVNIKRVDIITDVTIDTDHEISYDDYRVYMTKSIYSFEDEQIGENDSSYIAYDYYDHPKHKGEFINYTVYKFDYKKVFGNEYDSNYPSNLFKSSKVTNILIKKYGITAELLANFDYNQPSLEDEAFKLYKERVHLKDQTTMNCLCKLNAKEYLEGQERKIDTLSKAIDPDNQSAQNIINGLRGDINTFLKDTGLDKVITRESIRKVYPTVNTPDLFSIREDEKKYIIPCDCHYEFDNRTFAYKKEDIIIDEEDVYNYIGKKNLLVSYERIEDVDSNPLLHDGHFIEYVGYKYSITPELIKKFYTSDDKYFVNEYLLTSYKVLEAQEKVEKLEEESNNIQSQMDELEARLTEIKKTRL